MQMWEAVHQASMAWGLASSSLHACVFHELRQLSKAPDKTSLIVIRKVQVAACMHTCIRYLHVYVSRSQTKKCDCFQVFGWDIFDRNIMSAKQEPTVPSCHCSSHDLTDHSRRARCRCILFVLRGTFALIDVRWFALNRLLYNLLFQVVRCLHAQLLKHQLSYHRCFDL